ARLRDGEDKGDDDCEVAEFCDHVRASIPGSGAYAPHPSEQCADARGGQRSREGARRSEIRVSTNDADAGAGDANALDRVGRADQFDLRPPRAAEVMPLLGDETPGDPALREK